MRPERAENDLKGLVCPEVHKALIMFSFFRHASSANMFSANLKEGRVIDRSGPALAIGEMTLSACGKRESRG